MYPIAYPMACILDYFLGESRGTIYKKAGSSFHKYLDSKDIRRFNILENE